MKKWWLLIAILSLFSAQAEIAMALFANSPSITEPDPAPISSPPPSVYTMPPEEAGDAPGQAFAASSLVQVGPVSFDAEQLTAEQRAELIHQLQLFDLRSSLTDGKIIAGLETTRNMPCYIGQSARFRQTAYGDQSDEFMVTMSLVDIKRGEEAAAIAANMVMQYSSEASVLNPDMEYAVCIFDISATADNPNQQIQFTSYDFQAVSPSGEFINQPMLLANDDCYLTIVPGGSGTLQVVLAVEKETTPTVLYLKKIWFSMLEPA